MARGSLGLLAALGLLLWATCGPAPAPSPPRPAAPSVAPPAPAPTPPPAPAGRVDAQVRQCGLLLDRHQAEAAERCFADILKQDMRQPDAHAGKARAIIDHTYDLAAAMGHIEQALAIDPRHAGALATRAGLEIDSGYLDRAVVTLELGLAAHPGDLESRSLLAAARWLSGDQAAYEEEKQRVFARDPRFASFFRVVAEVAARRHRHRDAVALLEQALAIDPDDHATLAAIGMAHLRLGADAKGLEYVRRADAIEPADQRNHAMLALFGDRIPREYERLAPAPSLELRVARPERGLLERRMTALVVRALAAMEKRYGFKPTTPLLLEVFTDADNFRERSYGLPYMGPHGVCFGQVISLVSPSAVKNMNWSMVLWHEVAHSFALQLSQGRVPRWFSEGLAGYEASIARPQWRREKEDLNVWLALEHKRLPSIADLDAGFIQARDEAELGVAHHLAQLAVSFIVERVGFLRIVEALKLYGAGKSNADVLAAITGLSVAAFDAELLAWLGKRVAVYRGMFHTGLHVPVPLPAAQAVVTARPDDVQARIDLGMALVAARRRDEAKLQFEKALALGAGGLERWAHWGLAVIALKAGSRDEGRAQLNAMLAAGGAGYEVYVALAQLDLDKGDLAAAEKMLAKAKQSDPARAAPYAMLGQKYADLHRDAAAIRELEQVAERDESYYEALRLLVELLIDKKQWNEVVKYSARLLDVDPFDDNAYLFMGRADEALRRYDWAIFAYQTALTAGRPTITAQAHVGLARIHLKRNDREAARQAVAEALRVYPGNAEALELQKRLR